VVDELGNPFLITPPPGLLPVKRTERTQEPEGSDTVPAIALPPEFGDSGTIRVTPSRAPVTARPPVAAGIPYSAPALRITPPAAPAIPAPAEPAVDNNESDDHDETRVAVPKASTWRLALADGQTLTVTSALFIGRNPARAVHDSEGDLLPVDDLTKSVSKTHAFIEVDAAGLWVTDLDSTNGVFVALPDAEGVQAEPGERVSVPAGADIVLGEFVIQVERG
jgi:hypothetical protein